MNKVLLNGLHYAPYGAGISRYTEKLLKAFLSGQYDVDILIQEACMPDDTDKRLIPYKVAGESSTKRILAEQIGCQKYYKKYDIVHFPDYATPLFYRGKTVVTIHDMAMHTMRDKYTLMQNITKNVLLQHTIKHADRLICVSAFSKRELLTYYPEVEPRVRVIHEGIDIPGYEKDVEKEQCIAQELGIRGDFILYVGTIAPHKNITRLIQAFVEVKAVQPDYQLVIAGKRGWMYEEVFKEVGARGLQDAIIFTDFVADEVLEVLYRLAKCFVSVSLYEGFGFPPLEAMGRGCPVVVSDIEVFREVCGDKVRYCDPNDVEAIAKVILGVLANQALQDEMRKYGVEHVKQYTWERAAKQTFKVYQELMEG